MSPRYVSTASIIASIGDQMKSDMRNKAKEDIAISNNTISRKVNINRTPSSYLVNLLFYLIKVFDAIHAFSFCHEVREKVLKAGEGWC